MDSPVLAAVGDISFGDNYASASMGLCSYRRQNPLSDPFSEVKSQFRSASLVFGNLETVLSDAGLNRSDLHSVHMRGRPDDIETIVDAGFDVVNVANNHMLQHGEVAFHDTIDALQQNDISVVGLARDDGRHCVPLVTQLGDTEAVFLGYGFEKDKYHRGTTLYAQGHEISVLEDIRAAKSASNVVICSFHWGKEFIRYPSSAQVGLAQRAVEAGCDLILGHHPHVMNGFEYWKDGLVFYSLGNFLFDQFWNPHCREGCVVHTKLVDGRFQVARSWATEVGSDFIIRVRGDESQGAEQFRKLNDLLRKGRAGDYGSYEADQDVAEKENRHRKWAYFFKNFYRYDQRIFRQIIWDTMRKKIASNR